LRLVAKDSYGSAMQYFTGNKEHNVVMRKIAIKHGWKLNEYGLFRGKKRIAGRNEEEIYKTLGMQWIPPELRENRGEIEKALDNKLPKLVNLFEIKGDLQMHTQWSDGVHTIEKMIEAAKRLGHEFIAITDHGGSLKIAGALSEEQVEQQAKEIERLRERYDDMHIFHGMEVNILKDGNIDVSNKVLKKLDIVVASIHSAFRMEEKEMTNRLVKAIRHTDVNVIAHPTCRVIQKREPINVNLEKVMQVAKDNDVALEINAYPERLDLNDVHTKTAVEMGVMLSIGTDAHSSEHLKYYELGVAVARRGWAKKQDIINTYNSKELEKIFEK
jgi:DNA polymerase (family 10)